MPFYLTLYNHQTQLWNSKKKEYLFQNFNFTLTRVNQSSGILFFDFFKVSRSVYELFHFFLQFIKLFVNVFGKRHNLWYFHWVFMFPRFGLYDHMSPVMVGERLRFRLVPEVRSAQVITDFLLLFVHSRPVICGRTQAWKERKEKQSKIQDYCDLISFWTKQKLAIL